MMTVRNTNKHYNTHNAHVMGDEIKERDKAANKRACKYCGHRTILID